MVERKVNPMGGNSFCLTLPKELCKKAGVTKKTIFNVELVNNKFMLTKVK